MCTRVISLKKRKLHGYHYFCMIFFPTKTVGNESRSAEMVLSIKNNSPQRILIPITLTEVERHQVTFYCFFWETLQECKRSSKLRINNAAERKQSLLWVLPVAVSIGIHFHFPTNWTGQRACLPHFSNVRDNFCIAYIAHISKTGTEIELGSHD